jgi:uridine monophosphate synthetase
MYDGKKVVVPPEVIPFSRSKKGLLVDEAIRDGKTTLDAIRVLRGLRIEIADVITLVDCMMGGRELLRNEGVRMHAVYSIEELVDLYAAADIIGPQKQEEAMDYIVKNR